MRIALILVAVVVISLIVIETSFMIKATTIKPSEDATVVVLGCRVYGTNPSIMLASR